MERAEILVVAEHREGTLDKVSLELAEFGRELAEATGAEVRGIALSAPGATAAEAFARESGLPVLAVEHERLGLYNAEAYLAALGPVIRDFRPHYILIAHTPTGWDFAPRLAVAANGSCVTGVIGHKNEEESAESSTGLSRPRLLCFVRPVLGGRVMMAVTPDPEALAVITVMPGAAKARPAEVAGRVERLGIELAAGRTRTRGYLEGQKRALDLSQAEVIVAAGRGLDGPEHLGLVRALAAVFARGAVGASRPVVDAGWLPLERQVGMTGQTVAPKLYLACGISGALQHVMGMSRSDLIVAVNRDPRAPIFNVAHLGVVADLHEFLPILTRKIREEKV